MLGPLLDLTSGSHYVRLGYGSGRRGHRPPAGHAVSRGLRGRDRVVEPDSDVPLYQQLGDRVVEAIATGELRVGASLPATRQVATDLGINMHTVNKAYDLLRGEGLIRLGRRTGAVVIRDPATGPPVGDLTAHWETRARTLLAEAVAQGVAETEIQQRCQGILEAFRTAMESHDRSG